MINNKKVTTTAIIILIVFCFGASIIQSVTGFGFGIFIMTVLPFIMPSYGEATTLSGILAIVLSTYMSFKYHYHISWKKITPILIVFLITSYFAISCVAEIDDYILKKILGIVLICISIYFFIYSEDIRINPTIQNQIGLGTLSGLMGGFFGMQGPPAVLYFLSSSDSKEEYIAAAQTYFLIGNFMMTIYRAQKGFITAAVGEAWLIAIAAVCVGIWIGTLILKRMSIAMLKRVSYIYMGISGIIVLII